MTVTVGAGIGGSLITAPQATWLGNPSFGSARTPTFKTAKGTWNQHPVQGGPYLRNGNVFNIGSARVLVYLSANMTVTGDVMNTGDALWLASALGGTATLTQLGTTTAYELGGAAGATAGFPEVNNTFIDAQMGVPLTTGTVNSYTYHSGVITKSEWVFEATGLVTFSHDIQFAYVETATSRTNPSEPGGPVPFTMVGPSNGAATSSVFKMGTLGAEAAVDGVRKATITLERKMDTARMYLGNQYIDVPVSNDLAMLTVTLDWDNTVNANTAIAPLQIAGTATSVVCGAVGGAIGSSGSSNTFQLNATNCFLDTGGEQSLDGPDLVKNTATFSGTIDTAGDAGLKAVLITADTAY